MKKNILISLLVLGFCFRFSFVVKAQIAPDLLLHSDTSIRIPPGTYRNLQLTGIGIKKVNPNDTIRILGVLSQSGGAIKLDSSVFVFASDSQQTIPMLNTTHGYHYFHLVISGNGNKVLADLIRMGGNLRQIKGGLVKLQPSSGFLFSARSPHSLLLDSIQAGNSLNWEIDTGALMQFRSHLGLWRSSSQSLRSKLTVRNSAVLKLDTFSCLGAGNSGNAQLIFENNVDLEIRHPNGFNGHFPTALGAPSAGTFLNIRFTADSLALDGFSSVVRTKRLMIENKCRLSLQSSGMLTVEDSLYIDSLASLDLATARFINLTNQTSIFQKGSLNCFDSKGLLGDTVANFRSALLSRWRFSPSAIVNYAGGTQKVNHELVYPNLWLQGTGDKTPSGRIRIEGNLEIKGSNSRLKMNSDTLELKGNFWVSTSTGNGFAEDASVVILSGTNQKIRTTGFNSSESFFQLWIPQNQTQVRMLCPISLGSGGALRIDSGVLQTDTFSLSGAAALIMNGGRLEISKTGVVVPELPGAGNQYTLNGGSIELNGKGSQTLRGSRNYFSLIFSGSGTKTITSSIQTIPGTVRLKDSVTVDVGNLSFGGSGTGLTMEAGTRFKVGGTGTKPDMTGSYSLNAGSVIEFTNSSQTAQIIRLSPLYANIEVSGKKVENAGTSTPLVLQSRGLFWVKPGSLYAQSGNSSVQFNGNQGRFLIQGTMKIVDSSGLYGNTQTALSTLNLPTFSLDTGSTVEYAATQGRQIVSALPYFHLAFSGNAQKIFANTGGISIPGNIQQSGGRVSWPDTLLLNGQPRQELGGLGLKNLICSGSGLKTLVSECVLNGFLEIRPGATLDADGDLDDKILRLRSDSLGIGCIKFPVLGQVNGKLTYERQTVGSAARWYPISIPLEGVLASDISPTADFGTVGLSGANVITLCEVPDSNTTISAWRGLSYSIQNTPGFSISGTTQLKRGTGMFGFIGNSGISNSSPFLVDVRGTLSDSTVSRLGLPASTRPVNGFSLIGNPFPAILDLNKLDSLDLYHCDPTIYQFRSARDHQYAAFHKTTGIVIPVDAASDSLTQIPPLGVFFVKSKQGVSGSVRLKKEHTRTDSRVKAHLRNTPVHLRLRLQLSNGQGNEFVYQPHPIPDSLHYFPDQEALWIGNDSDSTPDIFSYKDGHKLILRADSIDVFPIVAQLKGNRQLMLRLIENPDSMNVFVFNPRENRSVRITQSPYLWFHFQNKPMDTLWIGFRAFSPVSIQDVASDQPISYRVKEKSLYFENEPQEIQVFDIQGRNILFNKEGDRITVSSEEKFLFVRYRSRHSWFTIKWPRIIE